jgi:hypothetical protein
LVRQQQVKGVPRYWGLAFPFPGIAAFREHVADEAMGVIELFEEPYEVGE